MWNQGAQENIVTITSKDSDSLHPDPSSSGKGSKLGGGAIAGIVIGCILFAALVAAAIAFFILRKRRKWIGKGFAVARKDPEPDESVLKGPVFNSPSFRRESTPGGRSSSTPYSAADISATRTNESGVSTMDHSRSGSGTSPHSAAAAVANTGGGGTAELDGHDTLVKPKTELDGTEVQKPLPPVAENPVGIFELPGSSSLSPGAGPVAGQRQSVAGSRSTPSPLTSTADRRGSGWQRKSMANSELVSPDTPTHPHGERPF